MLIPSSLLGIPYKSDGIQMLNPLGGDVAWLAVLIELELFSLFGDPARKAWIGSIATRHNGVACLLLVFNELL